MNPYLQGLYILLGILIGAAINILVDLYTERRKERLARKRLVSHALKEIRLNLARVNYHLVLLEEYRRAVSVDDPGQFLKYFSFVGRLIDLSNQLLSSGILYDLLAFEDVERLQKFFTTYGDVLEKTVNDGIAAQRANFDKQKAVKDILLWEHIIREQRDSLNHVVAKLEPYA